MQHLSKFLSIIKKNPNIFKSKNIILILGLTSTQIKELKKYASNEELITQTKLGYFLTLKGEDYLKKNPIKSWYSKEKPLRPNVNIEALKEEKTPPILTKAIRNLAKHLLEKQPLKEFSLEQALFEEFKNLKNLILKLESELLNGKRNKMDFIYENYINKGLTKSIISVVILYVLNSNLDKIAIYEKGQFQLKLDYLMFDRIIACPQNFEIQLTEMSDEYLLKDISKIILNKKSNNILEITKGLYKEIKALDKYTMNTQNLSNKTLRLRNVIVNAKDPISLFERDIPKVLSGKVLKDCDREFLNELKISLKELRDCTENLILDLKKILLNSFKSDSKENLAKRFEVLKEYIGEKDLKILLNNILEISVTDYLWINRIATFINKFRVPKDWSDEDFADFKVKTNELALKFFTIEATIGTSDAMVSEKYHSALNKFVDLSKEEQMLLLRKIING